MRVRLEAGRATTAETTGARACLGGVHGLRFLRRRGARPHRCSGPLAPTCSLDSGTVPPLTTLALATKNTELLEMMTELFYWKEIERRARAAQTLAMLHNRTDADGVNQANAILDELCLDRKGAERLIRSRMPQRPSSPQAH